MKRAIRLKELGVNLNKEYIPSSAYLASRPLLDPHSAYQVKTCKDGNQVSVIANTSNSKVYLLGASTLESLYIKASARPHSILESLFLNDGYDVQVSNLGTSGTHLLHIVNLIINKVANSAGQTVVVTPPSNDVICLRFADEYWTDHRYYGSLIPANNNDIERVKEIGTDTYLKALLLIKSVCDIFSLQLFFTTIIYSGENRALASINQLIRKFCAEYQVDLIDFERVFSTGAELFYDSLHFLEKGSQLYAEFVFNSIRKKFKKTETKHLQILPLLENCWVEGRMVSKEFSLKKLHKAVLVMEVSRHGDKPALFSIDYFPFPNQNSVRQRTFSLKRDIGYYSYINPQVEETKIELSFDIDLPEESEHFSLKFIPWGKGKLYIFSAKIFLIYEDDLGKEPE